MKIIFSTKEALELVESAKDLMKCHIISPMRGLSMALFAKSLVKIIDESDENVL